MGISYFPLKFAGFFANENKKRASSFLIILPVLVTSWLPASYMHIILDIRCMTHTRMRLNEMPLFRSRLLGTVVE